MLTQTDVKRLFDYDPVTGFCARLTKPCNSVKIGSRLGYIQKCGRNLKYLSTELHGKNYKVHRLIWLWMTGEMPENHIDHIDGNGLNNVWSNLREVTRSENLRNRKRNINNKSGQTGVSFHARSQKWRASINIEQGIKKHLGYFDTFEEAKKVRIEAEKLSKYHPNHGRTA